MIIIIGGLRHGERHACSLIGDIGHEQSADRRQITRQACHSTACKTTSNMRPYKSHNKHNCSDASPGFDDKPRTLTRHRGTSSMGFLSPDARTDSKAGMHRTQVHTRDSTQASHKQTRQNQQRKRDRGQAFLAALGRPLRARAPASRRNGWSPPQRTPINSRMSASATSRPSGRAE